MIDIESAIKNFIEKLKDDTTCIYNEFSLQHELGIFLKNKFPEYKVEFERNITHFYEKAKETIKHEIDIVVFKPDSSEKYAIELKYPRNGQYPEQMYAFIKDIAFMEECKKMGFNENYTLTIVDDRNFYFGNYTNTNIYRFFRGGINLAGIIKKPTGKKYSKIKLSGNYSIVWKDIKDNKKYYTVKI